MATSAAPAINHDSARGGDAQVVEVAEMLDAAADVQLTIGELDGLLARLRRALAVRQLLAAVDPATLQAALLGRRRRMLGEGR
jgi:hypothetical protein